MSWGQTLLVVLIVAVAVLLAGLLVVWARSKAQDPDASVLRSWIAISLVLGLLLFCAFSFAVDDANLRSILIGALITSVGSAVTFYFMFKSAEEARKDVLSAGAGMAAVPDLSGKTKTEAVTALENTIFGLVVDPKVPPDGKPIRRQEPTAGTMHKGPVTVYFAE